jgi:hypothetical protein
VTKLLPGVVASGISGNLDPGSYYPIATTTVPSAGAATVTFSSIPSTYTHLQLRFDGLSSSNATLTVRYNSDTGSNYSIHYLLGSGSASSSGAETTQTLMTLYGSVPLAAASSQTGTSIIDILDYANTNKYKTLFSRYGSDNNGTPRNAGLITANWRSTSAISSVTLAPYPFTTNTWVAGTTFALYGMG